ncbi:MAG: hypothetical protein MJE66_03235 [Proteobacteria bacterium]|nr:hypothetical protein [Pseudomonadota bacterium]
MSAFPSFDPVRVRLPIRSDDLTIWPGPPETPWDWLAGFPLELRPLAWDYLWVSSDGGRLEIRPHYFFSTWDTFWTEPDGRVTAQALGGLFPFTLGEQARLLEGILSILGVLPKFIEGNHPETAEKLRHIEGHLQALDEPERLAMPPEQLGRVRRGCSQVVWRWKLGIPRTRSASGP